MHLQQSSLKTIFSQLQECPNGLGWNLMKSQCDWPSQQMCGTRPITKRLDANNGGTVAGPICNCPNMAKECYYADLRSCNKFTHCFNSSGGSTGISYNQPYPQDNVIYGGRKYILSFWVWFIQHFIFLTSFWRKKAGYLTAQVACGQALAVISKANQAFGQKR